MAAKLVRAFKKGGMYVDQGLVTAAALLLDLAKGHPRHAHVAADILRKRGYERVADLVASHMDSSWQEDKRVTELDILCLSDRVVEEDRLVGLDYKFQKKMGRHQTEPHVKEAIRARFLEAVRPRQKVEDTLGEHLVSVPALEPDSSRPALGMHTLLQELSDPRVLPTAAGGEAYST